MAKRADPFDFPEPQIEPRPELEGSDDVLRKGIRAGVYSDGMCLEMRLRNLFRPRDFTEFKFKCGFDYLVHYNFDHSQELMLNNQKMRIGVTGGIEKTLGKFESREVNAGISLEHELLPFTLRLLRSYRVNLFDKYASLEAFRNELMPSRKMSFILGYMKRWQNTILLSDAEFGIPSTAPNFLRANLRVYGQYLFAKDRFKLGYDLFGGIIQALSFKENYVHINDRFFLSSEYGFSHISHTEPPARPYPNLRRSEEVIGDDLGTTKILAQTLRLHWMNIPFLKSMRCSPMTYVRMCYYPKGDWRSIKDNLRVSAGVGLGFNIIPDATFVFYYNLGNLVSQKGDYERTGFGINVTIF